MKNINSSINSMRLVKHIRIVLRSPYLANQISNYCGINVKTIHNLRHHTIEIDTLPLADCWKLERFYRHNFFYGMDKSSTIPYTWHRMLSRCILHLLHKICLCAWSMKPDASIWSDFKKLAKSYGKYYNYGMSNHPKVATVGYVKHILHLPYRYAISTPFIKATQLRDQNGKIHTDKILSWSMPEYTKGQPEVSQLGPNQFSIIAPYNSGFHSHLHFELAFKHGVWYLLTDVNPQIKEVERQECRKLSTLQYKNLLNAVYKMCIRYQINHSGNDVYFIEISDYSLQNAYYRLVHFELVRLALIKFLKNTN